MASSRGGNGESDRESREAAALRANLARRKDQKRARRETRAVPPSATAGQKADTAGPASDVNADNE